MISLNQELKNYNTYNANYNTLKSRLYSSKKRGLLSHVRKGVYFPAEIEDKFQIACNSVENGCIVYQSALKYYNLHSQEVHCFYVYSPIAFRTFIYKNDKYIYKALPFQYKPVKIKSNPEYPITVTSISQTVIDCLSNISLAGGIEEFLFALLKIDPSDLIEEDMIECLGRYNKKSLYQRSGFIFSQLNYIFNLSDTFFEACKSGMGKNTSYLINPKSCDSYNKDWNICTPKNIIKNVQNESSLIYQP